MSLTWFLLDCSCHWGTAPSEHHSPPLLGFGRWLWSSPPTDKNNLDETVLKSKHRWFINVSHQWTESGFLFSMTFNGFGCKGKLCITSVTYRYMFRPAEGPLPDVRHLSPRDPRANPPCLLLNHLVSVTQSRVSAVLQSTCLSNTSPDSVGV